MNKKRILILSPDSKHFVREYIENALLDKEYEVAFFTILQNPSDQEFYKEKRILVKSIKKHPGSLYSNMVYVINAWLWLITNVNRFDVIHIHFVDVRFLDFCSFVLRSNAKIIMTYWGSDLLRSSQSELKKMVPWISKSYKINFNDYHSKLVFTEKFSHRFDEKLYVVDFGNSLIDHIEKEAKRIGKDEAKRTFGFPVDKLVVHIGYNGSHAQQHVKILEALNNLKKEIKDKLFVVIPFSYGVGGGEYTAEEYSNIVKTNAKKTGISYTIFDEYIKGDRLADFRLTADAFVYGQTTDAMSASIIETVYAGGIFIKPAWLDYTELEKIGIKIHEFNEFSEISNILSDLVMNQEEIVSDNQNNQSAIRSIKSWEVMAPKWRALYE